MTLPPLYSGGCQCGAVRYALFEPPVSTICHCRMCQKAVGGPFAAFAKLPLACFAWTRGAAASFPSSSVAERHFCARCGTPLTFHFLDDPDIEVTTGSLDNPATLPPTRYFGTEGRLPWIAPALAGVLPETPTADSSSGRRSVISHQHPDQDTPPDWAPPQLHRAEPQLFVADIGAACGFYRDILGFSVAFAHGDRYTQVRRDNAVLNLRAAAPPVLDVARGAQEDLLSAAIPIDDTDRLFAEFQAAGALLHQPPRDEPWGARTFIVRDPDGNLLLFAGPFRA